MNKLKYSIKSRIEPVPHGCQARASTNASNLLLVVCYETTRPQCMCTLVIKLPVSSTELSLPSLLHRLIPPHSLTLICFQLQLLPHLKVHPFSPEYRRGRETVWVECIVNNFLFQILVILEKDCLFVYLFINFTTFQVSYEHRSYERNLRNCV